MLEEASLNGASAAQIELLESARDVGQVTVEATRQARRAFASCAADAGVRVSFTERTRPDGWVSTVTRVEGAGSSSDPSQVANGCERAEALWVTMLYDTQPSAVQATSDYLDGQGAVLRECLEKAGFRPEDATGAELAILSTRTEDPSMREAGAKCLMDLGVDGF